jgi:DNA-binding GntR family transcriptional regulator
MGNELASALGLGASGLGNDWHVKSHMKPTGTHMAALATRARKSKKPKAPKAERSGLADQHVHAQLYAAIIDHRIPPGTALLEDRLAKAFAVSRTVIRKVLQQLSHQKLVDIIPNKGASVAKPSAEEARQVFEARREIERILVERAVRSASDAELKNLAELSKLEQQAHARGLKAERLKLSGEFHRQLAALAKNAVLESFVAELVSRTSLIIALYESPGAIACSHTEHLEIGNAMILRDTGKAVAYMEHHLHHIEAQIDLTSHAPAPDFQSLFSQRPARRKK